MLQQLVTERVIPASLLKATQSFPGDDQDAVEAHILEVARWERQEIARQIALVRQDGVLDDLATDGPLDVADPA